MSDDVSDSTRILEERLRLGAGFGAADRDHVLDILSAVNRHLAHWRPDQVNLEISVKDRGGPEQKVTLEAWLPAWPSLLANSADPELDRALTGVRRDMIRQIEDQKSKHELHRAQGSRRGPA